MSDLERIAREAYERGENVSAALRERLGTDRNTPEIIKAAYDLQAGTYVQHAERNPDFITSYAQQLADLLSPHLEQGDIILDAGAGELTILSHMVSCLSGQIARVYACDISDSRLEIGRSYAETQGVEIETFTAELSRVPFDDNSVDVVTTNHAIEPNGGHEREILSELLRIARRKLVLFEPCYELASPEGKERMQRHGYIRDLAKHARDLGALVDGPTPLSLVANPLNPTACFVVQRP